MKKLLLLILLTSNLTWAEDNSDRWKRLPPIVLSMLEEFPHTAYATLACFDFPKINIKACEQLAEVDHPGSGYAKHIWVIHMNLVRVDISKVMLMLFTGI